MADLALLLTCEHGGNRVPAKYAWLFRGREGTLKTHRGYDPGALALARRLARQLRAPLLALTVTRLLIENNRSLHHSELFSDIARQLDAEQRREVIERYYLPHREAVRSQIAKLHKRHRAVLHLGLHSFTPVRRGEVRPMDVGLLYDPSRTREKTFCQRWARALCDRRPNAVVRFNAPYRGTADGLTTALRKEIPADRYMGIEIEVNQKHVRRGGEAWRTTQQWISDALREATA